MSELGSGNFHGDHGGGPRHTPKEPMRPIATLAGVALAIAVVGLVLVLAF